MSKKPGAVHRVERPAMVSSGRPTDKVTRLGNQRRAILGVARETFCEIHEATQATSTEAVVGGHVRMLNRLGRRGSARLPTHRAPLRNRSEPSARVPGRSSYGTSTLNTLGTTGYLCRGSPRRLAPWRSRSSVSICSLILRPANCPSNTRDQLRTRATGTAARSSAASHRSTAPSTCSTRERDHVETPLAIHGLCRAVCRSDEDR